MPDELLEEIFFWATFVCGEHDPIVLATQRHEVFNVWKHPALIAGAVGKTRTTRSAIAKVCKRWYRLGVPILYGTMYWNGTSETTINSLEAASVAGLLAWTKFLVIELGDYASLEPYISQMSHLVVYVDTLRSSSRISAIPSTGLRYLACRPGRISSILRSRIRSNLSTLCAFNIVGDTSLPLGSEAASTASASSLPQTTSLPNLKVLTLDFRHSFPQLSDIALWNLPLVDTIAFTNFDKEPQSKTNCLAILRRLSGQIRTISFDAAPRKFTLLRQAKHSNVFQYLETIELPLSSFVAIIVHFVPSERLSELRISRVVDSPRSFEAAMDWILSTGKKGWPLLRTLVLLDLSGMDAVHRQVTRNWFFAKLKACGIETICI